MPALLHLYHQSPLVGYFPSSPWKFSNRTATLWSELSASFFPQEEPVLASKPNPHLTTNLLITPSVLLVLIWIFWEADARTDWMRTDFNRRKTTVKNGEKDEKPEKTGRQWSPTPREGERERKLNSSSLGFTPPTESLFNAGKCQRDCWGVLKPEAAVRGVLSHPGLPVFVSLSRFYHWLESWAGWPRQQCAAAQTLYHSCTL